MKPNKGSKKPTRVINIKELTEDLTTELEEETDNFIGDVIEVLHSKKGKDRQQNSLEKEMNRLAEALTKLSLFDSVEQSNHHVNKSKKKNIIIKEKQDKSATTNKKRKSIQVEEASLFKPKKKSTMTTSTNKIQHKRKPEDDDISVAPGNKKKR